MGLLDRIEYFWNPEKKEADLLSDFVDTINQYGLASREVHDKYQSIVEQFPQMNDLLLETFLIADYYKNNKK